MIKNLEIPKSLNLTKQYPVLALLTNKVRHSFFYVPRTGGLGGHLALGYSPSANEIVTLSSWFLVLLFGLLSCCVYSQTDSVTPQKAFIAIGIRGHTGFIIPHSESIRSISYSKPWIVETDLSWHFSNEKAWQYCSCYPRIGVSLFYVNFDNPDVLGHAAILAPYVEPFLSAFRKFSISIRFGGGVAFLDNVYDPEKNLNNLFYSTPISFLLSANATLNYRVTPRWNIRLSGYYNHISNGGNKEPNKGINFPTAACGIDYLLKPVKFPVREKAGKDKPLKRSSLRIGLFGTAKKPFPEEHKRYLLYGCNTNWSYLLGRLSAVTVGLEYTNDGSLKENLLRSDSTPPDHKRLGLLAGHELQVGRFRFSQQLGVYLYAPAKGKDPVYQRWGLDFFITKWLYTGVNLKAHRHVADFMDFRFGLLIY